MFLRGQRIAGYAVGLITHMSICFIRDTREAARAVEMPQDREAHLQTAKQTEAGVAEIRQSSSNIQCRTSMEANAPDLAAQLGKRPTKAIAHHHADGLSQTFGGNLRPHSRALHCFL